MHKKERTFATEDEGLPTEKIAIISFPTNSAKRERLSICFWAIPTDNRRLVPASYLPKINWRRIHHQLIDLLTRNF